MNRYAATRTKKTAITLYPSDCPILTGINKIDISFGELQGINWEKLRKNATGLNLEGWAVFEFDSRGMGI